MDNTKKVKENLLSYRYNVELSTSFYYRNGMKLIEQRRINAMNQWLSNFEKKLSAYLSKKKNAWDKINRKKRCRDLNNMLDVISEGIEKLRIYGTVKWVGTLNETAITLLNRDKDFNCIRKLDNIENPHKYITKKLDDLCEDIYYLNDNKAKLIKKDKCDSILKYITDKKNEIFKKIADDGIQDKDIFGFCEKCTRESIESMLKTINCTIEESPAAEKLQESGDLAETEADKAVMAPVEDEQEVDEYAHVLEDSPSAFEIPEDIKTYGALSAAGTFFVCLLFYRVNYNHPKIDINILYNYHDTFS
ncbi:hypothetical protein PVBG_00606 [Plasmodium vivax Brazil I]|uniref:Pv-fam-c protein n=1 Tax=Plasmodium vivax (strain Brazil I) TaxID=1033975 RepID=A0A0J9SLE3_PLAV1|nr:hypothetical protein PVBG_00606 [Plasmodium vivax Brazil I]